MSQARAAGAAGQPCGECRRGSGLLELESEAVARAAALGGRRGRIVPGAIVGGVAPGVAALDVEEAGGLDLRADSLVDGARDAASEAADKDAVNAATLLVSCVGRKIIMGSDVDEEVEAVIAAIGPNSSFAGFYSYGEICPHAATGTSELHNQTMTITHISEAA